MASPIKKRKVIFSGPFIWKGARDVRGPEARRTTDGGPLPPSSSIESRVRSLVGCRDTYQTMFYSWTLSPIATVVSENNMYWLFVISIIAVLRKSNAHEIGKSAKRCLSFLENKTACILLCLIYSYINKCIITIKKNKNITADGGFLPRVLDYRRNSTPQPRPLKNNEFFNKTFMLVTFSGKKYW